MSKKYSIELKLKIINEYLTGDDGFRTLESKYNISHSLIRTWFDQYHNNGVQGLTAGMTKSTYSKSFKLTVLQHRLEHQLSYRETAEKFDIPNFSLIAQWQSKYNQYGILGLETKQKGRPSKSMKQNTSKQKQLKPLNQTEREELERLRVENRKLEVAIALEKKLQSLARDKRTKK